MKTSNKILLIFFVAAILMMTAVHLTLYAKYKKGEFSSFQEVREGRFTEHPLPKIKYVSVTGFQRFNIMPATETKIKIFDMQGTRLSYKILNDTLVITGDSLATKEDFEHERRNFQAINLYLTGSEEINASYTGLLIDGGTDTSSAPSWSINLIKSNFTTKEEHDKKVFFNSLQVKADKSNVVFTHGALINQLNIQTNSSSVNNQNADIKHLQLNLDDNSTIILQGNNLKDINVLKK